MLGELSGVAKIYLVSGYIDMRRSIDGLMAIIRDTYELDPYSNSLFLFCGKRCDRLKALHFDKDGEFNGYCVTIISGVALEYLGTIQSASGNSL